LSIIKDHKPVQKSVVRSLRKNQHLLLMGPNGIGKTTLLESIAHQTAKGVKLNKDVEVGYYRQDFSNLDFNQTARESLISAMKEANEHAMRGVAAGFQITGDVINTKVGDLSEGQKGLVAFARLVLQKPGLLILDEPTNHINFRHLPVIAKALDAYQGALILVSHSQDFVNQIRIDDILDLDK
ncbi:MAG: ATP-binding cassette domain-containing protein, partial [Minisyncoccia bacterium]